MISMATIKPGVALVASIPPAAMTQAAADAADGVMQPGGVLSISQAYHAQCHPEAAYAMPSVRLSFNSTLQGGLCGGGDYPGGGRDPWAGEGAGQGWDIESSEMQPAGVSAVVQGGQSSIAAVAAAAAEAMALSDATPQGEVTRYIMVSTVDKPKPFLYRKRYIRVNNSKS
jgi:hypothetical protein